MTLGGRRVLRNEGPWGADKDSMEVVTKGYVDAQIAGIAAGIDTVSLHAQLFADINDKLASWRDTSRAWRTYVNRKGGAVIIDSSGALYTFSLDADSVTVWKTDTSGNGAWYYKLPKSLFDMMAGLRDTSRAWRTYINAGTNVTVDSSDALYTISATGGGATGDSLRRISAAPIPLYGHGVFGSNPDTAEIRIFGANVAGALGAGSTAAYMGYTAGHFPRSVVLDAVEITHAFDTLGALRRRDTLIYLSGLDSIPAGTNVWFSYHPASDVAINGTGAQVISLYYATINAASGTFSDFRWKLPLILGTLTAHMGVHSDHNLKVTLWAREKIPGRVY